MTYLLTGLVVLLLLMAAKMRLARYRDHNDDKRLSEDLLACQPEKVARFTLAMITHLPEPAQRFFRYTIEPGTPLYTVATIKMQGKFSLGTQRQPNYLSMTAIQTLAAPFGFVWKMSAGKGLSRLSGSDSHRWTRFWLAGILPVARYGDTQDHWRSAFGRYIAEAGFWTPAVLLNEAIEWQSINADTVRYTISYQGISQAVDLTLDSSGKPLQISFKRWSNANPDKQYQLQPFGGFLSDFKRYQGFMLPTHVEGGNDFGTDNYFPFYIVDITRIVFPAPNAL